MHRAVDPSNARRIVLTAQETTCPTCQEGLSIRQHRQRYIWRLDGLVHQLCRDKRCLNPECPGSATIYRPLVDLRLALPRMSFGLDVVVAVGERHLDRAQSLRQIGRDLVEQGVPIHQTHVGELLRTFVVLCQLARGDQEKVKRRLVEQGGIYLMVDGVQFDDRSPVLYLCWDARSGTPLFGERLATRDASALSQLLRRVRRLGVPVRGITTDAEKGLVPAVAQVFPEVPHQLCHTHFLKNCARPLEEDLRRLGASVEQRAEQVRKLERRLDKEAPPAPPAAAVSGAQAPPPAAAVSGAQAPPAPPAAAVSGVEAPMTEQDVARALCALVKPNQLEGFFGLSKRQGRGALGAGSTTHSVVHNLGAEVLLAYQQVRAGHLDLLADPIDPQAYRRARQRIEQMERPARQRRSFVRHLDRHLSDILSRWLAPS